MAQATDMTHAMSRRMIQQGAVKTESIDHEIDYLPITITVGKKFLHVELNNLGETIISWKTD